jgi:hypothetical protein
MRRYRKVVIARTVLLVALLFTAGAFAVAVHEDKTTGNLLDEEGVIDREMVTETPAQ